MNIKILYILAIIFLVGCNNLQFSNYNTLSKSIINYKKSALYTKGFTLYKSCIVCHGKYGEKSALGITKPINNISNMSILLKKYKQGKLNKYGKGLLMKSKLSDLSDLDISTLSIYISKLSFMYSLKNYKSSSITKIKIAYRCSDLSETEAYSLLHMGHTYLDRDGDGNPCEWGRKIKSSYSSNCSYVRGYYRKNGTYVRGYTRCR